MKKLIGLLSLFLVLGLNTTISAQAAESGPIDPPGTKPPFGIVDGGNLNSVLEL